MRRKSVAWLAAGIAGVMLVFALRAALHCRDTAAHRGAIHNLQEIDKAKQADAMADELIAHYRLDTNGNDSLGKSPPLVVINSDQSRAGFNYSASFVISNAPFTHGVLYIDGRYEPNGHFIKYLSTACIDDLRYEAFTVALDFYPLPNKRGHRCACALFWMRKECRLSNAAQQVAQSTGAKTKPDTSARSA